jgi:hypothetical protein
MYKKGCANRVDVSLHEVRANSPSSDPKGAFGLARQDLLYGIARQ